MYQYASLLMKTRLLRARFRVLLNLLPLVCTLTLPACQFDTALMPSSSCADFFDNDGDGWLDTDDPDCMPSNDDAQASNLEELGYGTSACNDGLDNDGDLLVDNSDGNCDSALDDSESISFGELQVSEVMADPQVVSDSDGEWLELHNLSRASINLLGWQLADSNGLHIINQPVIIHANSFVVLSRNMNAAENGGLISAYQYQGMALNNSGERLELREPFGDLIDAFEYPSSEAGRSIIRDETACFSTLAFGMGDAGSPGRANELCE